MKLLPLTLLFAPLVSMTPIIPGSSAPSDGFSDATPSLLRRTHTKGYLPQPCIENGHAVHHNLKCCDRSKPHKEFQHGPEICFQFWGNKAETPCALTNEECSLTANQCCSDEDICALDAAGVGWYARCRKMTREEMWVMGQPTPSKPS